MKVREFAISLACLSFVGSAAAATIQFDVGFTPGSGLSTNFANAAGVVSNGLEWGIMVDTGGNGFLGSYDQITATTLTSGAAATDDLFFFGGTTYDSSQGGVFTEGDFVTSGGNGGLGAIVLAYSDGAAAGQAYQIVWFDGPRGDDGVSAGTFANGAFILPPAADTVDHSAPFIGVDPVRSATGTTFGVPEPSITLLGALGFLGLIRRRR